MEKVGAALARATGIEVCSLRIGNLAGADAVLGGWKPGFELDTFEDGQTPQRSYLGFRVLARIIQRLAIAPHLPQVLNVAQPGLISMGDLLDTAGLQWRERPAPPAAVKSVHLSTDLLEQTLNEPLPLASPGRLTEEWRRMMALPVGAE